MAQNKYLPTALELLKLTAPLIEGPNKLGTQYKKVLQGISRRSYFTLYSITGLAEDQPTADSILDLSRRLLEDMIAVEFIKLKGKEKMAQKFIDYMYVEMKDDMEFLIANGSSPSEDDLKSINEDFDRVKKQFERKDGKMSHSWAECSVESMMEELLKAGIIKDLDRSILLQSYIMGNRKNHLSPLDVLSFWNQEARERNQEQSIDTGIMFSIVSYLKIVIEFAKEEGKDDLVKEIEDIWNQLNRQI